MTQDSNSHFNRQTSRVIIARDPESRALAEEWSRRLNLPLAEQVQDFALVAVQGRLELQSSALSHMKPLSFEFDSGPVQQRLQSLGKANPLVKALGAFRKGESLWDLSFGQGLDTLLFLKLGLRVKAFERDPFIYALACDALRRVQEAGTLDKCIDWNHLELIHGDASAVLGEVEERPEYIYFDPMFSEEQKALPRKEMQYFARLVGNDTDAEKVFELAYPIAKKRTIVKRSDSAPNLSQRSASHTFSSKLVRFDMYLTK